MVPHIIIAVLALNLMLLHTIISRRKIPKSKKALQLLYWCSIVILCMSVVRLADGRVTCSVFSTLFLVTVALLLWLRASQ